MSERKCSNEDENEGKTPVTRLQFLFLMIIFQNGNFISVDDILQTIQMNLPGYEPSTGAIYKTLNILHQRCLINKRVQETDKRIKHYIITNKGRDVLQKLYFEHLSFMKFMQKCCASCSVKSTKNREKQ